MTSRFEVKNEDAFAITTLCARVPLILLTFEKRKREMFTRSRYFSAPFALATDGQPFIFFRFYFERLHLLVQHFKLRLVAMIK